MEIIIYLIAIPFVTGALCLLISEKTKWLSWLLAAVISFACLLISIFLYQLSTFNSQLFLLDGLNKFIVPTIALFGFLIILYSLKFMSSCPDTVNGTGKIGTATGVVGQSLNRRLTYSVNQYYAYILWTLSAAFGAVLSNNLILLLVFWGFLGLTLYLLIQIGHLDCSLATKAAKKTFIIIGGSDCLMLLGIAIIWFLTGTFQMDKIHLGLINQTATLPGATTLPVVAFLCLVIAAFAKAGAMPFHTWIPDMSVTAPVPVTAFLPASLDKLLGIYLLARICLNLFNSLINQTATLNLLLMSIGAVTIIAAVFMAMVQHDLKKLLSYHAISQVGYMVLGIGTGNPIGIAGGLFHMLNNAIYKSCLFLCGGSVEHKTGTSDLDKLGGLAKYMPVTFVTCLIAAFSISGVPPFNGFFSKWMIYQGIIESGLGVKGQGISLWWVFLAAAMFGSALTLASFMKLIHAIFLGQSMPNVVRGFSLANNSDPKGSHYKDVPWTMWLPQIILAALCVIFGIFAFQIPLKYFILPSLSTIFTGLWQPGLATTLIIVGLMVGLIIYLVSKMKVRQSSVFIGGETLPESERVTGVDFYQSIKDIRFFKMFYFLAEKKLFDIYDWGRVIVLSFSKLFSIMHTGNLQTYLIWCLVGFVILLFCLV